MPPEECLGADRERVPPGSGETAGQRGEHEAIRRPPASPRNRAAQDAHLVPQRQQFDVARRTRAGANHKHVQEHTDKGIEDGKHHGVSVSVGSVPLVPLA